MMLRRPAQAPHELFVLETDLVDDLRVRDHLLAETDGPRPRVRLGVVHRHFDIEMTKVRTSDPLADLAGTRQRTAAEVEPQVVAKTDGVDDERVTLPATDRVPLPRRGRIVRQHTTVEKDVAEVGVVLLDRVEYLRRLDEFDDMRQAIRAQECIG